MLDECILAYFEEKKKEGFNVRVLNHRKKFSLDEELEDLGPYNYSKIRKSRIQWDFLGKGRIKYPHI